MKVSIFDVAKKSGLSVVTVSRVLNGAETVREKNRQKVLEAMKELDYRPNAAARSLASGKTGIIGVILTTLHDSFSMRWSKSLMRCWRCTATIWPFRFRPGSAKAAIIT
ncbi:hypothetical protein HMSSN036_05340 [Paenibacillus macerans]|nr:hypothetical protein HMSSN036_05340 [Paenibacillus macerans]